MSRRVRRLAAAARVARVRCVCSVAALGERARRLQAAGEVQRIHRWRGEFCHNLLHDCTRGHLLTRRLASGCIRDAGWHRDAFCLLIAQSLTPHVKDATNEKHEPAVARGAEPSPARLETQLRERAGCSSSFSGGKLASSTGARGGGGGLPTASETAQKSVHKKAHRPSTGAGSRRLTRRPRPEPGSRGRPRSPPHPSKSRWPRGPRWCP